MHIARAVSETAKHRAKAEHPRALCPALMSTKSRIDLSSLVDRKEVVHVLRIYCVTVIAVMTRERGAVTSFIFLDFSSVHFVFISVEC